MTKIYTATAADHFLLALRQAAAWLAYPTTGRVDQQLNQAVSEYQQHLQAAKQAAGKLLAAAKQGAALPDRTHAQAVAGLLNQEMSQQISCANTDWHLRHPDQLAVAAVVMLAILPHFPECPYLSDLRNALQTQQTSPILIPAQLDETAYWLKRSLTQIIAAAPPELPAAPISANKAAQHLFSAALDNRAPSLGADARQLGAYISLLPDSAFASLDSGQKKSLQLVLQRSLELLAKEYRAIGGDAIANRLDHEAGALRRASAPINILLPTSRIG